jgi:hypothetical protein
VSSEDGTSVSVAAEVPHHLDEDWPDLGAPVAPEDTCLTGVDGPEAPGLPEGEPRGEADDGVDVPEWPASTPTAADDARVGAAEADPWLASVARTPFGEPETEAGDQQRHAQVLEGWIDATTVAEQVARMEGWTLTYAACGPHRAPTATLRLDAADQVVARLDEAPDGSVDWQVAVPALDGPDQSWVDDVPALEDARCLSEAPPEPVLEGTPVGLLTQLQPLQSS